MLYAIIIVFCLGLLTSLLALSSGEVPKVKELDKIEDKNKENILSVQIFLFDAIYSEKIGKLNNIEIFKYISNDKKTYEFKEVEPENNQSYGIDDNKLCFNRLSYKIKK